MARKDESARHKNIRTVKVTKIIAPKIKVEIIIPLNYNDDRPVEDYKLTEH